MLELQGAATGLLDDPLVLRVRGLGDDAGPLTWRARLRDDDDRVWRAIAATSRDLPAAFAPAKPGGAGELAALRSLRPARIDVRAEASDGRSAARTVVRALVGEGVRVRRWRGVLPDGAAATLHLPAGAAPCATVVIAAAAEIASPRAASTAEEAGDASADAGRADHAALTAADVAALAAPLLASRGVLALTVAPARPAHAVDLDAAAELLAGVPGAAPHAEIAIVQPPLPPGVPANEAGDPVAWDALLASLRARPRES